MVKQTLFFVLCGFLLSSGLINASPVNAHRKIIQVEHLKAKVFNARIDYRGSFSSSYFDLRDDIREWFRSHPKARLVKEIGQVTGVDGRDLTEVSISDPRMSLPGTLITITVIYEER